MSDKNRILTSNLFKKELPISRWDVFSVGILALFFILQLVRFPDFPLFLDMYYHLSVMLGFDQAGGYVNHAFWEYAPWGRPHLYPPLLHVVMLLLYKLGLSKITIARLLDFSLYPLAILTIWLIFRRLISPIFAFFAVLICVSSFTFYLSFVNTPTASIALIICMLALYFLEKNKILTSLMLLGMSFYMHLGISSLFIFVIFIYGILNNIRFKHGLLVILGGLSIALPLLIYFLKFRRYFEFYNPSENQNLEINILLYIGAFLGLIFCLKDRNKNYLFLALALGMLPLAFKYKFRYLCFQGLIGPILLCSVFMDSLSGNIKQKMRRNGFIFAVFILFFIFSPTIRIQNGNIELDVLGSNFMKLVRQSPNVTNNLDDRNNTIYNKKLYGGLVEIIKANSLPDEIIYSDLEWGAGLLAIETSRATSTAMLKEVKPVRDFDPITYAKLIILFREKDGSPNAQGEALAKKYRLSHLRDTELASIYINTHTKARRLIPKPLITTPFLFIILFSYLALLIISCRIRMF